MIRRGLTWRAVAIPAESLAMKRLTLAVGVVLAAAGVVFAQDAADKTPERKDKSAPHPADLQEVQKFGSDLLSSVTSIVISPDGKFLYAAAFNADLVAICKRDAATGKIALEETITTPELDAAVSVRLSRDGAYAVASAFAADAVTLFKRDPKKGGLTVLDTARDGVDGNDGLDFVIDANFSQDNRFLFTTANEGLGVYQVKADKLSFVQSLNAGGLLQGVRAATPSPDGAWLYAPAYLSGTLGVLRPDPVTGQLEVVQLLKDGEDGMNALDGVFRVGCSADGKHVYASAGRFKGDQAISVFEVQKDGKLKLIEEHMNGVGGLEGFEGGNDIKVSPDGKLVYALGTLSDRIVRFRRDEQTGKLTLNPFATPEPTPVPATPTPKVIATPKPGEWMFKNYRPALDPKKKK